MTIGPAGAFRSSLLILALLVAGSARAETEGPTPDPEVVLGEEGGILHIHTSLHVNAPPDSVWPVVLDYDGLADYMPNVDSSRVVDRNDRRVLVRQVGSSRFIFKKTFRFTLSFRRIDPKRVAFRQVFGSFDRFVGTWKVRPEHGGSRITYDARIRQSLHVPGFILHAVIRRDVRKMLPAIAAEVRRRRTAAAAGPGTGAEGGASP
jgi:carbon monoxide dehydrogenase subunit G